MNRIAALVTLAVALVITTAGTSQDKTDKKPKQSLPAGFKDLGLSAEQKGKVYAITAEYKAKILKLDEEIKALKAEEKAAWFKVLTDEQKKKYIAAQTGEKTETKKDNK